MKKIRFNKLTSFQVIVLFYFVAILVATVLLSLPFAHNDGVKLSLIDALYTAVSAVSVTGLSVISIVDTFNVFGSFILVFTLQLGGIGVMTLSTFIWLLLRKKIGFKERQLIMTDQNQNTLAGLVNLTRTILSIILLIEGIGTLVLGTHFLKYFSTWQEAYYNGLFAAVSATTNAGFDITGASLKPFANDYFVQFIVMILMILGAVGFPVLVELKEFLWEKEQSRYRFSLFTKITSVTFFGMTLVGVILIFLLERTHFFADKKWHETLFYALFQSVTTRSGGLSTMDVSLLTEQTQLVLSGMMFIGASPSSVGGGIRTTTFAIVVLAIFFYAKGKTSVKVFRREIYPEDITRAFVVTSVAIIIWGTSIIIMSTTETHSLLSIIFEVSSAFGTCGLSTGITPELSNVGKFLSMILMFIGRVGILTFLFLIRGKTTKEYYHYPKEKVIIG
jgi:Trk-type K+ transport system membrane component